MKQYAIVIPASVYFIYYAYTIVKTACIKFCFYAWILYTYNYE